MFGNRQRTIVANGCHKDIFVKLSANRAQLVSQQRKGSAGLNLAGIGGNAGFSEQDVYEHVNQTPGFVPIETGTYLKFPPIPGNEGFVFISVQTDSGVKIENFQVKNNRNVIINKRGYVRNAKRGGIWTDVDGKDHKPAEIMSESEDEPTKKAYDEIIPTKKPDKVVKRKKAPEDKEEKRPSRKGDRDKRKKATKKETLSDEKHNDKYKEELPEEKIEEAKEEKREEHYNEEHESVGDTEDKNPDEEIQVTYYEEINLQVEAATDYKEEEPEEHNDAESDDPYEEESDLTEETDETSGEKEKHHSENGNSSLDENDDSIEEIDESSGEEEESHSESGNSGQEKKDYLTEQNKNTFVEKGKCHSERDDTSADENVDLDKNNEEKGTEKSGSEEEVNGDVLKETEETHDTEGQDHTFSTKGAERKKSIWMKNIWKKFLEKKRKNQDDTDDSVDDDFEEKDDHDESSESEDQND